MTRRESGFPKVAAVSSPPAAHLAQLRYLHEANAVFEPVDQKAEMATVTTGTNPEVHYTGMFNPYGSLRTIIGIR